MLRNFRQVFKGSQGLTGGLMVLLTVGMLAYLLPGGGPTDAPDSVVARVYGRDVLKRDLDVAMSAMLERMGKQANLEMMLPYLQAQALRQVVNQKLSEELAERHGVLVTDPEVRDRMLAMLKKYPVFQNPDGSLRPTSEIDRILIENGQSLTQWEKETRGGLVYGKLIQQTAALVTVDEATLALEHRVKHEQIGFDAVALSVEAATVADPGDATLEAFLKESGARFQAGPRRVVQLAEIDKTTLGEAIKVDDAALQAAYTSKKAAFTEFRARHILFRAEGEAQAGEAMKKAEEAQAKLKGGADFGKLADLLTEDPSGKGQGGDLGWFKSGAMVKPFEDAAQALKPGEISHPVKTQFGVHLIQLQDRKEKSFEDMKASLQAELSQERFVSKAKEKLEQLRKRAGQRGDLAPAARALNLKVETSQPFAAEGAAVIPGIEAPAAIQAEAFRMKVGDVSKVTQSGSKFVVFRVVEEKPVGMPALAEVRPVVLSAYQLEQARKQAFDKATAALKGGDLKTVGPVTTQAPATLESLAELGQHPAIRKALLDTPVGGTTPVLWSPEGKLWVAKVTSKKLDTPLGFEQRHALVQKLQESGAEKRLTAELQYLENRGRMRPGLSSLWGRMDGIWMNPTAGKAGALGEE